ncbi:MAG: (2Fe-2S)-binding protein [Gammaproteobacteria bacterium]
MYVCCCNAVTDHRIREAVTEGDTTFEALQESLEVSTCCGCCESEVREILVESLKSKPARRLQLVTSHHLAKTG